MGRKATALTIIFILFAACAHQYRPIVDPQGKSRAQYEADLRD